MKKLISSFIILLMVVVVSPVNSFAEEIDYTAYRIYDDAGIFHDVEKVEDFLFEFEAETGYRLYIYTEDYYEFDEKIAQQFLDSIGDSNAWVIYMNLNSRDMYDNISLDIKVIDNAFEKASSYFSKDNFDEGFEEFIIYLQDSIVGKTTSNALTNNNVVSKRQSDDNNSKVAIIAIISLLILIAIPLIFYIIIKFFNNRNNENVKNEDISNQPKKTFKELEIEELKNKYERIEKEKKEAERRKEIELAEDMYNSLFTSEQKEFYEYALTNLDEYKKYLSECNGDVDYCYFKKLIEKRRIEAEERRIAFENSKKWAIEYYNEAYTEEEKLFYELSRDRYKDFGLFEESYGNIVNYSLLTTFLLNLDNERKREERQRREREEQRLRDEQRRKDEEARRITNTVIVTNTRPSTPPKSVTPPRPVAPLRPSTPSKSTISSRPTAPSRPSTPSRPSAPNRPTGGSRKF